ncbi:MAG: mucoidy inhibitor MuiA family protein [Hyphomicrobium sp.]
MRALIAATLLLVPAAAVAADVTATSRIDSVVVFPSGAEVMRVAGEVKLEQGEHVIVFSDVAASALPGSIRVEGKATGKLEIGSVDSRRLFVPRTAGEVAETERRRLETEVEKLRDERAQHEAEVQGAETQKSLIANLAQLPTRPAPSAGGDRGEDWPQVLALIASGSREAQRGLVEAQVKIRDVDRRIQDIEGKLAALAPAKEERTEVKVFVSAATPLEAVFTVRYQVPNASWQPMYDARLATGAKNVAPKLDLTRRASITQSTGEVWDQVALTLSTTRPSAGASAPELYPTTVDFEPEMKPRPVAAPAPMAGAPESMAEERMADAESDGDAPRRKLRSMAAARQDVVQQQAEVVAAPFQALYNVPGRLTIPDTGEAKRVQLVEESIEPVLTVRTVPKEDAKAFLYAKVMLPKSGLPLLPGQVSMFRDGTFVGTGRLPVLSPGEEHELGFGIDDLVRVKYAIAEEKRGETGLISTSRTDSRNFRIAVKNLHERSVGLTVFDQLPNSKNQDIKVELLGKSPPTRQDVEDKRGVLAWDSRLEPDQEQVIDFGYRVTWPSGKQIIYGR